MLYEFQHFGTSDYFKKEYGSNFNFPNHIHKSFELITVLSGEMNVFVENKSYTIRPSDAVLVFPNQIHSLSSSKSEHFLIIFSPEIVKAYFTKFSNMIPKNNLFHLNDFCLEQLQNLDDSSPVYQKKGVLYSVCTDFDKKREYIKRKYSDTYLLYKIFDFVEKNYNGDCSLSALSKHTAYSYTYLSKYFSETVKMPYNEYVNRHRIGNACYLLDNTDSTILECSMECGYESLRSFNRNFKIITGLTPIQYKKTNSP